MARGPPRGDGEGGVELLDHPRHDRAPGRVLDLRAPHAEHLAEVAIARGCVGPRPPTIALSKEADAARGAIDSVIQIKPPFVDKLIEQCADLKRFLMTGARQKLGSIAGGSNLEKLDPLCETLGNILVRMELWDVGMSSVVLCLDLLATGVMSYSASLPVYKSWMQTQSKRKHDGAAVEASNEPYLHTVVLLCKKLNFLNRSVYPKYNKRIPGGCETHDALLWCLYFAASSNFGQQTKSAHCDSKVHEAVQAFLEVVNLAACSLVDCEALGSVDASGALGLVLRTDIDALSKIVEGQPDLDNPGPSMFCGLPHFADAKSASMIIQQIVHGPMHMPSLQDPVGEPLSKSSTQNLVAVYANVASIMAIAAHVKVFVVDGGATIKTEAASFEYRAVTLLNCLQSLVRQVREKLAADDLQTLDSKGHRLRFGVFWCGSWLNCIDEFWTLACASFFHSLGDLILQVSTKVEKHLPHWGAWITDDAFDCELSKVHILDNTFKQHFAPTNEILENCLGHAEVAGQTLANMAFKDIEGMQAVVSFASGINASLEHYLLVQGALAAILCHGTTAKGQAMAQKVLAVNSADTTLKKLPRSLQSVIERLSEGDRSNLSILKGAKFSKSETASTSAQALSGATASTSAQDPLPALLRPYPLTPLLGPHPPRPRPSR